MPPAVAHRLEDAAAGIEPGTRLVLLRHTDGSSLYRVIAADGESASPRLLAVCDGPVSLPVAQRRMAHAFSFRQQLDPAFATVPLQLVRRGNLPAMLLTDPGGEPLSALLDGPMPVTRLLDLATGITIALGAMHRQGIVHKDVRPANILVDSCGAVFLTGFGGASLATRELPPAESVFELTDALPYLSPEQTGRLNRSVDTRSDLYGLGVTLYRMACGELPFEGSAGAPPMQAMEWLHCHLARAPVAPSLLRPDLPQTISRVILRLLSKAPDDRYQTAAGVETDLRRCAQDFGRRNAVGDFLLGQADIPDRLLIPEQLYGREDDIARLVAVHRKVATTGRSALVLVSGYSGVGKSAMVGELRKVLAVGGSRFASGKFEQHKSDIPYATFAHALQGLVAGLFGYDEGRLADWRERLRAAVGDSGKAIVNLVPELEYVIGRQSPLKPLPAAENTVRFQTTLRRFLSVFGSTHQPLVLFLDDLQWLDAASLDLLAGLVDSPELPHVVLIGAYRSNEVDTGHPLAARLADLRSNGAAIDDVTLEPLGQRDLETLVGRALRDTVGRSAPLARLVWRKTQGNPFFAHQFLGTLADEGCLVFCHRELAWQWDMQAIEARNYSDNVAELMSQKVSRMPPATRDTLVLLACLGASATLPMLCVSAGTDAAGIHARLAPAEQAGLVMRSAAGYGFMHDRIQDAAYARLPLAGRATEHLRIARTLRAAAPPPLQPSPMLFEIVSQFARSDAAHLGAGECLEVAGLYLAAARLAMAETGYRAALAYLALGEALLPPDPWAVDHRLAFDLGRTHAECAFAVGEPEVADTRLDRLAPRAETLVDKAALTWLQITVCLGLDQSARAIDTCLAFLGEVDTAWPLHPSRDEALHEFALLTRRLENRPIETLLDLPPMTDPLRRAILDVLAAVLPPAFFSDENLVCLVLCRMASLSIDHGNTDASPLAYAYLGMMAGPYFRDYESAFRFGKLGYDLVERGRFTRYKARVHMCFAYHVLPWARDIREGRALLDSAFRIARDTGDTTYAGFASCAAITCLLAAGEPLDLVEEEAGRRLAYVSAAKFGLIVDIVRSQMRLVATLQGRTAGFGRFDENGAFQEAGFEQHLEANRSLDIAACWYWIRKAQARFFAGDITAALHSLSSAEPLLWTSTGHFDLAEYHFYAGLIHAARCHEIDSAEPFGRGEWRDRAVHAEALRRHRLQIDEWAHHCPANFACRSALLAAEEARTQGREPDAMGLYEDAAGLAQQASFTQVEALAFELSARFHAAKARPSLALSLARSARLAYERWGATGKARQLENLYPALARTNDARRPDALALRPGTVDVDTLLRISRAIASEKSLSRLMHTLMTIALQHAGAERGLLVLPRGEKLFVAARADTRHDQVEVRMDSREPGTAELPMSVLLYVMRTRRHVLIDDAREPGPFASDSYLAVSGARSVLCLPLVRQDEVMGLLYLENSLAGHVFTPERLSMLGLLASMAATSLENASLGEKESLLQEVHHRVKNNLQLISSLLSLQASRIADPAVAELFVESRNRVRSMALVHENLYRAGNFARVPMAAHIVKLCDQLRRAYGVDDQRVSVVVRVDDIQLSLGRAVSCGLIVNELVSNALKHAFPGERRGELRIRMQATSEGRVALSVSDDGVGLPAGLFVTDADTLGLQLVDDLTQQLHGRLETHRGDDHGGGGASFVVTFDTDTDPSVQP